MLYVLFSHALHLPRKRQRLPKSTDPVPSLGKKALPFKKRAIPFLKKELHFIEEAMPFGEKVLPGLKKALDLNEKAMPTKAERGHPFLEKGITCQRMSEERQCLLGKNEFIAKKSHCCCEDSNACDQKWQCLGFKRQRLLLFGRCLQISMFYPCVMKAMPFVLKK